MYAHGFDQDMALAKFNMSQDEAQDQEKGPTLRQMLETDEKLMYGTFNSSMLRNKFQSIQGVARGKKMNLDLNTTQVDIERHGAYVKF